MSGRKSRDLTGMKFGRLTVLRSMQESKNGRWFTVWDCECECGVKWVARASHLTNGNTSSCGCLRREMARHLAKEKTKCHER